MIHDKFSSSWCFGEDWVMNLQHESHSLANAIYPAFLLLLPTSVMFADAT